MHRLLGVALVQAGVLAQVYLVAILPHGSPICAPLHHLARYHGDTFASPFFTLFFIFGFFVIALGTAIASHIFGVEFIIF